MHRRILALILLLLSTAVLPIFAYSVEPIKIGASLGLTGKYAEMSNMSLKGFKLWETHVNQRGGILGRPVQVIIYDDKGDPALARNLYTQLILNDKVDLVFGPYSSEITEAVLPITEQYKFPLLASGAAADGLWQKGYKHLFGVYVTSDTYTAGFVEVLVTNGISPIAIISADDLFSKGIAESSKSWAKRFGLKVVFSEEFKKGTKELEPIIRKAQASGAQALLVCGHFEESINARLALNKAGWSPQAYYATIGPSSQKYWDILQKNANNTFFTAQWVPSSPFPGVKEFTEAFIKTYNEEPIYHAASTYAAGQILETAIGKVKSIDHEAVSRALFALDTISVVGRYGVDNTGKQIRHFTLTMQWQNNKKEIISPIELMTAKPIWKSR